MSYFPEQRENFTSDLLAFSLINENTVEKILETRITEHNQRFYKVRWKDSWLLEEQLKEHCYEILKRFWRFPEHMGADPSQLPGFGKTFTGQAVQTTAHTNVPGGEIMPEFMFGEEQAEENSLLSLSKQQSLGVTHAMVPAHTQGTEQTYIFQQVPHVENANTATVFVASEKSVDEEIDKTTPNDAITHYMNTEEFTKVCLDCNEEFKTKCRHCLGCRKCRNRSRCHFYECHGEKVCAICEHCFEGDQCKICCPYCGQVYPTGGHWRRHIRVTHLGLDKPKSQKKSRAIKQVDSETGEVIICEKNYKCETCEKTFISPHKLKRHEKIHSTVREFKCHVCQKEFVQKVHLTKHLLQHGIGEKRFKCHNCEKWFNHKISLKTHVPKCTGERI